MMHMFCFREMRKNSPEFPLLNSVAFNQGESIHTSNELEQRPNRDICDILLFFFLLQVDIILENITFPIQETASLKISFKRINCDLDGNKQKERLYSFDSKMSHHTLKIPFVLRSTTYKRVATPIRETRTPKPVHRGQQMVTAHQFLPPVPSFRQIIAYQNHPPLISSQQLPM